jgi:uncharacterized protein YbcC (UPF0753/DUF2309 family)
MTVNPKLPSPAALCEAAARVQAAPSPLERAEAATRRVAPLWPLRNFVAVNPFLGVADRSFAAAARIFARVAGARTTVPRALAAEAIRAGRIGRSDLLAALEEVRQHAPAAAVPATVEELEALASQPQDAVEFALAPTVADTARDLTGVDWPRFVVNQFSFWASGHFDEGQAYWRSPWHELSAYAAWRAEAAIDRSAEIAGIRGFRARVEALPGSAPAAIELALRRLAVPDAGLETYLHRLLVGVGGWAAFARYQVWEKELRGSTSSVLLEVLAIRLAWELALLDAFADQGLDAAWQARRNELAAPQLGAATEAALAADLALQIAFETAVRREVLGKLAPSRPAPRAGRASVQAAFCIDVRSEVFRRALEATDPTLETIGFAGFFGFPIEYVRFGDDSGGAQCPVLLTPQFVIREAMQGASGTEERDATKMRQLRRRATNVWRSFKFGAVSCFGFVGPVGLAYAPKLLSDSLGWSRPVEPPDAFGVDGNVRQRLAPLLDPGIAAGRTTGMTQEQRLTVAEGVLKAMSLTRDFARIVLLVGHGSTTANNPHASGLDCGACGGHSGEANARVAAAVLGDPEVRGGLAARGIAIPEDTVFVAAQHDTTTDAVEIFDRALVPASHAGDLARLEEALRSAGGAARRERAHLLHLEPDADVDAAILGRSRDWAQVRPEWGLAGCCAFVAAPRHRTQGVDLGGRSFLHSYDWQQDEGFGVLELIMTAPMIVASWISLQYYGSSVDNRVFGSGNKVLHNVVGTIGVLEGNGGDLRAGLPWQSLHDGESLIHEPVRLNVVIEAPVDAMTSVLRRHPEVRELLDNGWLHLFAMDAHGEIAQQYDGDLRWKQVRW